jgi:hypothetical protein
MSSRQQFIALLVCRHAILTALSIISTSVYVTNTIHSTPVEISAASPLITHTTPVSHPLFIPLRTSWTLGFDAVLAIPYDI